MAGAELACAELGADVAEGEFFVAVQAVAGPIAEGVDVVGVGADIARAGVWTVWGRLVMCRLGGGEEEGSVVDIWCNVLVGVVTWGRRDVSTDVDILLRVGIGWRRDR